MEGFTIEIDGIEYTVLPVLDNGNMAYRVEIEGTFVLYKINESGNLAAGVLPENVNLSLIDEIADKIASYYA